MTIGDVILQMALVMGVLFAVGLVLAVLAELVRLVGALVRRAEGWLRMLVEAGTRRW